MYEPSDIDWSLCPNKEAIRDIYIPWFTYITDANACTWYARSAN